MTLCPHCNQIISEERFGVRFPPMKAELIDRIRAAGDLGISTCELIGDSGKSPTTIKAHIWQINDLLAHTRWRIESDRRRWFLTRNGG